MSREISTVLKNISPAGFEIEQSAASVSDIQMQRLSGFTDNVPHSSFRLDLDADAWPNSNNGGIPLDYI
jgi:hypothetical protein